MIEQAKNAIVTDIKNIKESNKNTESFNMNNGSKEETPMMDSSPIQPLKLFQKNNSNLNKNED